MMDAGARHPFIAAIRGALRAQAPLDEYPALLRTFKERGLSREDAYEALAGLRGAADERTDDRIMEIMDFVAGWCQPRYDVWRDA